MAIVTMEDEYELVCDLIVPFPMTSDVDFKVLFFERQIARKWCNIR